MLELLDLRWMAFGVVLTLFSIMVILGFGVLDKAQASQQYNAAAEALVASAEQQKAVISTLVDAGADAEVLELLWFKIEDAPVVEKSARAAVFVEAVQLAAGDVEVNELAQMQVTQLASARADWLIAKEGLHEARGAWLARLTGDLGVLPQE